MQLYQHSNNPILLRIKIEWLSCLLSSGWKVDGIWQFGDIQLKIKLMSKYAYFPQCDKTLKYYCMKKSKSTQDQSDKLAQISFKITFQFCLYLHSFQAISMGSQGSYYIAVSLCPKNALFPNSHSPTQSPLAKVHLTPSFNIKYTNHFQHIGEYIPFSFTFQTNMVKDAQEQRKNMDQLPYNQVIVLSFQLMKKIHDDIEILQDQPKLCEDYVSVGISSFQMRAKNQFSFSQHINAHFNFPYAAKVAASAFCLIKSVQSNNISFIQLEELCMSPNLKKKSFSSQICSNRKRQQLNLMKKTIKKHIFSSYIVRKQMHQIFKSSKKMIKNLAQSQKTWKNAQIYSKQETKVEQMDEIYDDKTESISCLPFEVQSSQTTKYSMLQKLTSYQSESKSLRQILSDLIALCEENQAFNRQLGTKINQLLLEGQFFEQSTLEDQYEGKRMIIYSEKIKQSDENYENRIFNCPNSEQIIQKSTSQFQKQPCLIQNTSLDQSFGESLMSQDVLPESGIEQMKEYAKDIVKMKKLGAQKCFSSIQNYFNLIPMNPTDRFDSCPFIFHNQIRLERKAHEKMGQSESEQVRNVFVFAHGYQANSENMELIKISFKDLFPDSKFLVLQSLQGTTDQDLGSLGILAAKQIESYLNDLKKRSRKKPRIVMVGHSMGGIILRATLKHLSKQTQSLLHTYISFATPHLGYLNCQSFITEAGIKIIQSVYSSLSVKQLSNRDHPSIKQTFIYQLSHSGPLTFFKNVLLFSSMEDKYVPWNSARVQIFKHPRGVNGKNNGGWSVKSQKNLMRYVQQQMINNIFGLTDKHVKRKTENIHRLEIDFNLSRSGIQNLIGRTAHVSFLVNKHIIPMAMMHCLKTNVYKDLMKKTD